MTESDIETATAMASAGGAERITAAVEQAPFLLAICEGPQLRLVFANAALRSVVPQREILGRPLREAFADLAGQHWLELYERVYDTGEPIGGREWRTQYTQADGSIREMYATFTLTPWRDADGRIRGVIGAGSDVTQVVRQRMTDEDDLRAMRQRNDHSRQVVATLQRELLPAGLPVLPTFQVGASYLPPDGDAAAGGDWFDAVATPDGQLAVIVGDVVGHGIAACATMSHLRAVLTERLASAASVAGALAAADRAAARLPGGPTATVCVALLNPSSGSVAYCTAGHPPPLIVAGGQTRFLPVSGAGPLGTGGPFPTAEACLDDGDLLLLYSDGIIDRPGVTFASAAAELAQVAAETATGQALRDPGDRPVDRVCGQTVELLVRATGHRDDVTLLAVQRVPSVPELRLRLPAALSVLPKSRTALSQWLESIAVSDDDHLALLHGVGEIVSNAVEHGRPDNWNDDAVALRVALTGDGVVVAEVADRGHWQDPITDPHRGRGLALAAELVDDLQVTPGPNGTTATIRHRLTRSARLLDADRIGGPVTRHVVAAQPSRLLVAEDADPNGHRIRVEGTLDAYTAGKLRGELIRRARGGVRPVTVDLTDVTVLDSAGVSVLCEAVRSLGSLTLHASPGSVADRVMSLVALPHTTDSSSVVAAAPQRPA